MKLYLSHEEEKVEGRTCSPLAGEDSHPCVGELLVLAKHVADLGGGAPNVSSRHISIGTNVAVQLVHEGLQNTRTACPHLTQMSQALIAVPDISTGFIVDFTYHEYMGCGIKVML